MEKMSIHKKLLEIQKQVPFLKKGTEGFNYKYTSPEKVLNTFNPLLAEQGLFLTTEIVKTNVIATEVKTNKGTRIENLFVLDLKMIFTDVETGEKLEIPWAGSGCNGEEKGFGSALTYAERYFFLKQFNVPTGEDDPDLRQNKLDDIEYESTIDNCDVCGMEITPDVVSYSTKFFNGKKLCRNCQKLEKEKE